MYEQARLMLGLAILAAMVMGQARAQTQGSDPPNPYRTVIINEFLSHTDPPDFDFIELFNYSASAVDLSHCILTDDPTTNRFVIPTNTVIQPQGLIYFDETRLGFALSAAGETIYFKDPNNTRVIEAVRFGAQENGVSTGRSPDGAAAMAPQGVLIVTQTRAVQREIAEFLQKVQSGSGLEPNDVEDSPRTRGRSSRTP